MKNCNAILVLFFFLSFIQPAFADDVLIPFGQNTGGAPVWKYKGGGTNLNAIAWKDLLYGEPGWVSGGSAFGFGATAPAHTTAIPQDASTGGGGAAGAPYPTMYFRKILNIPSLAAYASFQLRTQFDDAIVVWVNGVEAYRSNIAANPLYATYSNGTNTTYNNGATIFTATIAANLFVTGDNIIAVEIHQNNATSSDLFFDFELTGISAPPPPPPGDVVIFPFGQNLNTTGWKYKGGGTNLDAIAWKDLAYAEPAWLTGNSALGFGANPPVRSTAIPEDASAGGGGTSTARYPTLYFRKVVNITDPSIFAAFRMSTRFDDGIVVWINGVEAYRNNVTGTPLYADWAPTAISNNGADIYNVTLSSSMFNSGNNIIAVEIHQNTVTSSDLFFDMELTGLATLTGTLLRGPYLQSGNETAVTLRWRTDVATNSRVTWGTSFGTYTNTVDSATLTTDHIVRISGLAADTKYFYTIGSTTQTLQATNTNYVLTAPPAGSTRKLRFAAIGDCGMGNTNQVEVKNALMNFIGSNDLDGTILLGDNAYSTGTDAEYQTGFFDIYKNDILKNKKLYPAPGNHDYGNNPANTGNTGTTPALSMPYHNNFTVPSAGECGGVPSGSKAFYSYNIGDVHFVSLDSYGRENSNTTKLYDTLGTQAVWLKNDLAANTKRWTVVYFHHPPYTMTSHNSDYNGGSGELDLVAVRERFIRILERYGVDLVVCGHAHGFERSYLLKNYYNTYASPLEESAFSIASHTATGNNQNGKYNGLTNTCAYTYNSGKYNHGSMYIVAGSAGQIGGAASGYPHNAMFYSNNTNGGSFYFEVDSNRLDARFVSYSGTGANVVLRDSFTIFKDVNRIHNLSVTQNTALDLTASWRGRYFWPNNSNATTQTVTLTNPTIGTFTYYARDSATANCLQDVFNVTVTAPLPVSLLSFNATLNGNKVLLDWSTAQETNNKYFTIERSTNGVQFNVLGKVNGAVNSSTIKNYQLIDPAPAEGDNYYRLSQTNLDGNITYHDTRKVNYKNSRNFSVNIINTATEKVNVVIYNNKNDQLNMRVIDMLGKNILREDFAVAAGTTTRKLQLQAGVYVVVINNSRGESISTKLIVQ